MLCDAPVDVIGCPLSPEECLPPLAPAEHNTGSSRSAQVGRFFPHISAAGKVWAIFGVEHLVLLIFLLIHCLVPPVPHKIKRAMEWQRSRSEQLQLPF